MESRLTAAGTRRKRASTHFEIECSLVGWRSLEEESEHKERLSYEEHIGNLGGGRDGVCAGIGSGVGRYGRRVFGTVWDRQYGGRHMGTASIRDRSKSGYLSILISAEINEITLQV